MPAYTGLATGAGAAEGLETLFARMRADEALRQHQATLDQAKVAGDRQYELNNRTVGIAERGATRADAAADISNESAKTKMEWLKQIMGGGASSGIGMGGRPSTAGITSGEGGDTGGQPASDMERFDNPTGRTQFQIAGLNPNESFGSVKTVKGPEDMSAEETFYNKAAAKYGAPNYKDPRFPASEMEKARRLWSEQSHFVSPAQSSEPLVQIDDPDNPGTSIYAPRSQATGARGPLPAGQKDRVKAYGVTLSLVDEIMKVGDEIQWKGLGPIKGRVGRIGMEYLGVGDPREEHLRNMIDNLKAQASFQEGGKQFTGTESQLLNAFLSGVNQDPRAVRQRLESFKAQATRSLNSLTGNAGGGGGNEPIEGGDSAVGAPPPPPSGDMYQQYLARTKKGGK